MIDEGVEFSGGGGFEAHFIGDGFHLTLGAGKEDGEDFLGLVRGEGAVFYEAEEVAKFFRRDGAIGDGDGLLVECAEEVVDDEIRGFLGGDFRGVGFLEKGGEVAICGEDGGVIGGEAEVVLVAGNLAEARLGHEGADDFEERGGGDG